MPQVAYQCRQCGEHFRRVVFLGDEQIRPKCPVCGTAEVKMETAADSLFEGIASFSSLARDRN